MNSTCRFPSVYLDHSFSGQPLCACLPATTKVSLANAFPQNSSLITKANIQANIIYTELKTHPLISSKGECLQSNDNKFMTKSFNKSLKYQTGSYYKATAPYCVLLFHPHHDLEGV